MKVTVICQVYNSKPYIHKCIDSVLNQSFLDFDFLLIDNGCNDGTENILKEYAAADKRINLIRFDENKVCVRYLPMLKEIQSEYFTNIDSDDWYENDYLKRLVGLADKYNADIVTTGTHMRCEGSSKVFDRSSPNQLVIGREDFPKYFSFYHPFFRPLWGKLFRMSSVRKSYFPLPEEINITYGMDTVYSLELLRHSNLIVIDNSILHNYRIHSKSASYVYDRRQAFSDIYLYNDAMDFLSQFGDISEQNITFINLVYCYAIIDTAKNILNSDLSIDEKASELFKILSDPITKKALVIQHDVAVNNKNALIKAFLEIASRAEGFISEINEVMTYYYPKCGRIVTKANYAFLAADAELLNIILSDSAEKVSESINSRISKLNALMASVQQEDLSVEKLRE